MILAISEGWDGMMGYSDGKLILGDRSGSPGFLPIQFHEHDAGDPRRFQLGNVVLWQVYPSVDLHDHADEVVVRGHPDLFHPAHIHAAELDDGVHLEALHRFVEIGDVGRLPFSK